MKKLLFAVCLLGVSGTAAFADTVCATFASNSFSFGTTLNMSTVNPCTVGTITFSNFQVYGANTFVPTSISGGVVIPSVSPNTLAFSYTNLTTTNGTSSSGVGGVGDIRITFQSNAPLSGIGLGGGTSSSVTELVCSSAFLGESCNGSVLGTATVSNGGSATIILSGFNGGEFFLKDIAGGSGVTQTFIPEPMSLSMMGLGLLGLGALARKRRKF